MKLINVLNKLANGEKIPTFRFKDIRYRYFMKNGFLCYQKYLVQPRPVEWQIYPEWLNKEVEIIESEEELNGNN